jgi:RNase adaptor protein for sRNA GlmZ degradation
MLEVLPGEQRNYMGWWMLRSVHMVGVLQNGHYLYPDVLAHAAFLPRPNPYQQLREMVGHAKENMAVQREKQMAEAEHANRNLAAAAVVSESSKSTAVGVSLGCRGQGCCRCGQSGHLDFGR